MSERNFDSKEAISSFLNTKSKDELIELFMSMTSSSAIELNAYEQGEIIDTMQTYTNISLDGYTFIPEELVAVGYNPEIQCTLSPEAWRRVRESRKIVDNIVERKETVYGINTGFGNFANVVISEDQLRRLQVNLIRSHASGVGEPLELKNSRMLLALRINVLARGHSGIRPESIETMLDCLNKNCISWVPARGTVGASGDLAPLSHLALGMMGEGKMYDPELKDYAPANEVLQRHNIKPLELYAKEGLALINGTQLITSIGAEAVVRAKRIARQADVVASLTLEALCGSSTAFHPLIHNARPHPGQRLVAARIRSLLGWNKGRSSIASSHVNCSKVQDSYTLRCIPQIHGISHDTINWVYEVIFTEMNSATDNPMVFANANNNDINSWGGDIAKQTEFKEIENRSLLASIRSGRKPKVGTSERPNLTLLPPPLYINETEDTNSQDPTEIYEGVIVSGGNFHGEYPAKVLDYLAIAIHEIASVSERRIERLVNPQLSGLPAFLVPRGGLNSGFMIAHCAAAALVSENKGLCHPASIDSISTSAAQEDHVSMGGYAARKALQVVANVEYVVAIELLAAIQGLDFHHQSGQFTTSVLEDVFNLVRTKVEFWSEDRYMNPDIEIVQQMLREEQIWSTVKHAVPYRYHNTSIDYFYDI